MLDPVLPFDLSFQITIGSLRAVLAFIFLVWLVATVILVFHWVRYGSKNIYIIFAGLIYFSVSVGIIGWLVKIVLTF